jgi:hypothetical protein
MKSLMQKHWLPVVTFIFGVFFTKGVDLAVDFWKSPNRSFSFSEVLCKEPKLLDKDSNKKSWLCSGKIQNHTGVPNRLKISCKTNRGNFSGSFLETNRGGGIAENRSPICFGSENKNSRSCHQSLQQNEFIEIEFEVISDEKPIVSCNSDSI